MTVKQVICPDSVVVASGLYHNHCEMSCDKAIQNESSKKQVICVESDVHMRQTVMGNYCRRIKNTLWSHPLRFTRNNFPSNLGKIRVI